MSVTMLRWTIVDGCVRWMRITAPRWVAPVARGLPSLGPCFKVAAVAVPLAGVGAFYGPFAPARPFYGYPLASQAPGPAWAQGYATGAGYAPAAGLSHAMSGGVPVVSGPGAFAGGGGGNVVAGVPMVVSGPVYPVWGSMLGRGGNDIDRSNRFPDRSGGGLLDDSPPPSLTLPPVEHSSGAPPTSVPEPASILFLAIGVAGVLVLRRRG